MDGRRVGVRVRTLAVMEGRKCTALKAKIGPDKACVSWLYHRGFLVFPQYCEFSESEDYLDIDHFFSKPWGSIISMLPDSLPRAMERKVDLA